MARHAYWVCWYTRARSDDGTRKRRRHEEVAGDVRMLTKRSREHDTRRWSLRRKVIGERR